MDRHDNRIDFLSNNAVLKIVPWNITLTPYNERKVLQRDVLRRKYFPHFRHYRSHHTETY